MVTDETLYCRYIDGDESALRELMERYGDALTMYIAGMIHDVHDAEDLMLDAFVRIVMKRPHIWDKCFKAYLYKTARNLALRFAARRKLYVCFDFEEVAGELKSEELVEAVVQNKEQCRILHLCMERLHDTYSEALYLVYQEEMSYKEAASVMGKTEKQVSDLVYRGRQALRKLLEQEGITNAYNG